MARNQYNNKTDYPAHGVCRLGPRLGAGAALLFLSVATASAVAADAVYAEIRLVTPQTTRVDVGMLDILVVDIGNYRGPAVVLLDGQDISALVQRQDSRIQYRLPQPLAEGTHRFEVWATDPSGPGRTHWEFAVQDKAAADGKREIYSRSTLSVSVNGVAGDKVQGDNWTASGNLGVDVGTRSGEFESNLVANFNYASNQTGDQFTPGNYTLSFKHDDDSLAIGDVNFTGTPLTASGLARRGALATVKIPDTEVQLVQVNSNPVVGWDSGLSSDNQIYGTAVKHELRGSEGPWHLSAALLSGENLDPNVSNVSSSEPPNRGKVAGLQGSGRVYGTGINAEAGYSKYDANTNDSVDAQRDKAATLQLDRALGGIAWTLNYLFAGADFASIANPRATRDREQYGLAGGTGFGISSVSASVSHSHDNVDSDPTRPVVFQNSAGLTYALSPKSAPAFSASYQVAHSESRDEPLSTAPFGSDSRTLTGALSYTRKPWSANFTVSNSAIDDPLNGDSTSASEQLAINVQPNQDVTFATVLSFTQSGHVTNADQDSGLALLTGRWRVTQRLEWNGQLSYARNEAADATTDNSQIGGVMRLAWDMSSSVQTLYPGSQANLSLSLNFNHYRDAVDPTLDTRSNSILLGVSVFAPIEGRYGF